MERHNQHRLRDSHLTEDVDAEVEGYFGYFEFLGGEIRSFQFAFVRGDIDFRESRRDGQPFVEFSWDGKGEMDPARGRGWAMLDGDQIDGIIFIHRGDESAFKAMRA
jgi:hypothetical protein